MEETSRDSILHAYLIDSIGEKAISLILSSFSHSSNNLYEYSRNDFIACGLSEKKAVLLCEGLKNYDLIREYKKLLQKHNCRFFISSDLNYPRLLKLLTAYPPIIFYQSIQEDFKFNQYVPLALVSSRKTNAYGKKVIYELVNNLPTDEIVIISGGAIGGDTFIHEAALRSNIPTVSYIGSGLAEWYPQSNSFLFKKIIDQGGAIMSHFLLSTKANKITFPIRNNIIAAMSAGTIVIQAGEKSGTLITANYALEYGRSVGAIPGPVDDILMIESHNLLKNGAFVITSSQDILQMLGMEKKQYVNNKNNQFFSDNQKLIIEFCREPRSLIELASLLKISYEEVYDILYFFLDRKMITQDFMGNWITCC